MSCRSVIPRLTVVALALATVPNLGAQQPDDGVRLGVVLSADTVRVGEPFTIGVVAVSEYPVSVPPLLPSGEGWEQLNVARVETTDSEFRAYYRLVAWQTDRIELPELSLSLGSVVGREVSVSLPMPIVQSILPASAKAPLLQSPRPPRDTGFPWPLLLVGLILLALSLWWLKHRATPPVVIVSADTKELDVAARARAAVLALRAAADAGSVAAAGFYDELEQILRNYLSGTRAWPPEHPVRESKALAGPTMHALHRQALLARFAAVGWARPRLVADADTSLEWLTEDEQ